jgi:putative transposase
MTTGILLPYRPARPTIAAMPRSARAAVGGYCYHVINRGNGRAEVFHKDADFAAFARLLRAAPARTDMRLLGYCLMPNHFHLVLWPVNDDDLGRFMQWLLTTHVRRYHMHYHSTGHVWQGRFKAFPIEQDEHLLTVLRYVPCCATWNATRCGRGSWSVPKTGVGRACAGGGSRARCASSTPARCRGRRIGWTW